MPASDTKVLTVFFTLLAYWLRFWTEGTVCDATSSWLASNISVQQGALTGHHMQGNAWTLQQQPFKCIIIAGSPGCTSQSKKALLVQQHWSALGLKNATCLGFKRSPFPDQHRLLWHTASWDTPDAGRRSPCCTATPNKRSAVTENHETIDSTYRGRYTLWLAQEAARLADCEPDTAHGLLLTRGAWRWDARQPQLFRLHGYLQFHNTTNKREIFIPEVTASIILLSRGSLDSIQATVKVTPHHDQGNSYPAADSRPRQDGYWSGYILKAECFTVIEVTVSISAASRSFSLADRLTAASLRFDYSSYGPYGQHRHVQHVILPLAFPTRTSRGLWSQVPGRGVQTLPISTHLLCHLDDPVSITRTYVSPHAQPGDVLTIAESPLAIMQGRFRHPHSIKDSWIARRACLLFKPTSSLATAKGMQALVDIAGGWRVVLAVVVGILGRLLGQRGMFYSTAGEQSTLIDDLTGTLPPYDQFIVLGPVRCQETVDAIRDRTGIETAIVDINDLTHITGEVKVLAASSGVDLQLLRAGLLANPAGNADQQTPLVLIRP